VNNCGSEELFEIVTGYDFLSQLGLHLTQDPLLIGQQIRGLSSFYSIDLPLSIP
jgi:hypothetical protein